MQLTVACLTTPQQCVLRQFGQDGQWKTMDWNDLEAEKPAAIFFKPDAVGEHARQQVELWNKRIPVLAYPENWPDLTDISSQQAQELLKRPLEQWALSHNLILLENLFATIDHMLVLWPNQRGDFFEQLWHILRTNLAAQELTLIYNDLAPKKEENKKRASKKALEEEQPVAQEEQTIEQQEHARPKLMKVAVTGYNAPVSSPASQAHEALLQHCEAEFGPVFHLSEYSHSKHEMLATMMIKGSPVLLIAKVPQLQRLQLSLIKALIEGIQFKLAAL